TLHPSSASNSAIARPMPRVPPVIIAFFPFRSRSNFRPLALIEGPAFPRPARKAILSLRAGGENSRSVAGDQGPAGNGARYCRPIAKPFVNLRRFGGSLFFGQPGGVDLRVRGVAHGDPARRRRSEFGDHHAE